MSDCLFCKIIAGAIPAQKLYEDEDLLGFADLNPVAETHILFVPKKHISRLGVATDFDAEILGKVQVAMAKFARDNGLDDAGFRVVVNNGENAGQTVFHIHFHLLSGRKFTWPPG